MSQERRAAARAHVPGSFVHCETAGGEHLKANVLNLSTGGLFVPTSTPLAAGKRFSLRIRVGGGPVPWWTGLARVMWVRESPTGDGPAGMGVKILDLEDDAAPGIIARVVDEHLKAQPAVVPRERTVLGVGPPSSERPTLVDAGELGPAPARERTVLGVGAPQPPAEEERSVVIELVSPRPAPKPVAPEPPQPASTRRSELRVDDPSLDEVAVVPRRRGAGLLVLLLIVVGGGGAGYVTRDSWLPRAREMLTGPTLPPATLPPSPSPTQAPSPSVAPTPTVTTGPTASASTTASASAPNVSGSARRPAPRPAMPPPPPPASAAPKSSDDNPY
jgi:hypothetical protein